MILSRATRKRQNNKGFTLVELILVMTIILMLAGLSTPLFGRTFSNLVLKDTAYNMAGVMTFAREMAVFKRKEFKVTFDFTNNRYQLWEIDHSVEPPVYQRVKTGIRRFVRLPQGVFLKGLKDAVVFYPDGRSDEARINVVDKNGTGYAIGVNAFGGAMEIIGIGHAG